MAHARDVMTPSTICACARECLPKVAVQGHSLDPKPCLQDLVAFEMVATPLNAPFALAAHLPPNLTTLKLQYLPDTWPANKMIPDEWQVCRPAHLASFLSDTNPVSSACCRICFDMLRGRCVKLHATKHQTP